MNEFLINLRLPAFQNKASQVEMLTLGDILYLQADSNYTVFYLQNGQKIITGFSLKHYEVLENLDFIRAHRSFIINATYIKMLDFERNHLVMKNGTSIVISRRRKGALMSRFQQK